MFDYSRYAFDAGETVSIKVFHHCFTRALPILYNITFIMYSLMTFITKFKTLKKANDLVKRTGEQPCPNGAVRHTVLRVEIRTVNTICLFPVPICPKGVRYLYITCILFHSGVKKQLRDRVIQKLYWIFQVKPPGPQSRHTPSQPLISFMPAVFSTPGRLHCELVRLKVPNILEDY